MVDPYRGYVPPLKIAGVDLRVHEKYRNDISMTIKRDKTEVWILPYYRFEPYRIFPFIEGPDREQRKANIPDYLKFREVVELIRQRNSFIMDNQAVQTYERIAITLEEVVLGKKTIRWMFEGI